ncbi:Plasmodium exported protein (PHISTb), unknown, putative [Plasmodium gaboni]|uniref:Plasmodium RESA N-terminal domain-containing protein n=1 Tax=Plasmodium gaboni TaxID=647221 RepID=A0ABY0KVZ6_9APIC|nr:Plasmodium exported protein (PHISTb), unknown, putative [Plasmodium gaboni]
MESQMKMYKKSVWYTLFCGGIKILIVLILNIILWSICMIYNDITLDSKYMIFRYIRILSTLDMINNMVNVKIKEEDINEENENEIKSIMSNKYFDNENLYIKLCNNIKKNMEQNNYESIPYSNEYSTTFYNEKDNIINNDIDSLDARDNLIRLKMYNIWLELMQNEQMKYYSIRHNIDEFYKNLNQKYNIKNESNDKALKECNEIVCLSAHYLQRHLNYMFNKWFKTGFMSIAEFNNIINATRIGWSVLTTNVQKRYKDILTDNLIEKINKTNFDGNDIFNYYLGYNIIKDNPQQYDENMNNISFIGTWKRNKENNIDLHYNIELNEKDKELICDNIIKNNSSIKNYVECLKIAEYIDVDTSDVLVKEKNNIMKRNIRKNNNIYKINNEEKSNNIEKNNNQNVNYNDDVEENETEENEFNNNHDENQTDDFEISLEDIFYKSTNIVREAEDIINGGVNGTSIDSCILIDKPEDYDKQIKSINNNNINGYLDSSNQNYCNHSYLRRKWNSLVLFSDKDKSIKSIICSMWKYVCNKNNLLYWRKFNTY